jgi:hypothetical protein
MKKALVIMEMTQTMTNPSKNLITLVPAKISRKVTCQSIDNVLEMRMSSHPEMLT